MALRHAGYQAALARQQLPVLPELQCGAPLIAAAGRHAVHRLLAEQIPFDGIFACSDLLAMAAISALRDRGLQVPAHVSVVGYDDIDMAEYFNPPLTTIRQSIAEGGPLLVDTLFDLLAGGAATPRAVPTELIVRSSTRLTH